MKVECIDDSNKPNEIRDINWVKKGREYTVIGVNSHPFQNNIKSFVLAEIDTECPEYTGYLASRFRAIEKEKIEIFEEEEIYV